VKTPLAPLSQLLTPIKGEPLRADAVYPVAGVYSFGRGLLQRDTIRGVDTKYQTMTQLSEGNLVYSKLGAFEGAVALVRAQFAGSYVSPEFPVFQVAADVDRGYLHHLVSAAGFADQLNAITTGVGARQKRVSPNNFLSLRVPFPARPEQRRIAAHLDRLAAIDPVAQRATCLASSVLPAARNELARRLIGTPRRLLGDILELSRRPVDVTTGGTYTEIGVRSFGRGLFVKEPVSGVSLGSKRVFEVQQGDLVVSNVFGWEGAVAIADAEHSGLIGSHRFMTWTPRAPNVLTSFVCHYLLSDVGLEALRAASPGSAGRNRTLSIVNFENIQVPLPRRDEQEITIARLKSLVGVADWARRGAALASAILPAARNQVFSSL